MIVFLYGKDSYRRLERKKFYAAEFQKKYGVPAEPIDLATEEGAAALAEAAASQSLFSAKKLLVLENAFEMEPKNLTVLLDAFMSNKDRSLLITETKKPVKALGSLLKKPVVAEEFEILKGPAWTAFVKAEAKKRSVPIDALALAFLAESYAGDSWGVVTELQKLAAAKQNVMKTDLEASGLEPEKNYFALVQTLRAPTAASRLGALETLLALQEPAAKVFHILASLWPQRIADFADYDRAIKFGRMDYEEALLDLAL